MIYKIFSEEKLSQAGQKKQKSIGIYIYFLFKPDLRLWI